MVNTFELQNLFIMNRKFLVPMLLIASGLLTKNLSAQKATAQLDINNVNAKIKNCADLFYDGSYTNYEFPKGSGKHTQFAASLWIGAKDNTNNQYLFAAQTTRQSGMDFYPGPLDVNGACDTVTSKKWDRLWKVNKTTIDNFKLIPSHTIANTDSSILEWPAKGNTFAKGNNGIALTINTDVAPFVDVNNNGNYEPLLGDYPLIKGDQSIFALFNDNTRPHTETGSAPLKLEVKLMAYASTHTSLDNSTFYEYTITNKSTNNFDSTIVSFYDDFDLGYYLDDYVGFDSTNRMGIGYNADANDAAYFNDTLNYGTQLTQTGVVMLQQPSYDSLFNKPVGSFMYFNNSNAGANGNPVNKNHFYNYSNCKWRDGSHLVNTCSGVGAWQAVNYYMPDDPSIVGGKSEVQCGNFPEDRRMVLSGQPITFNSGATTKFVIAIVNTDLGSNNNNFNAINVEAQAAHAFHKGKLAPMGLADNLSSKVSVYPNPAVSNLTIDHNGLDAVSINITSLDGRAIMQLNKISQNKSTINIQNLQAGNYMLQLKTSKGNVNKLFTKAN